MKNTRISAALFCTAFSVLSSTAFAEEPAASDVAAARALGQEGMKLADAGNCAEAIDRLARAEKLYHAPTTLARLGECQVQTGKIVEGTESLNRVMRESLPANAPAPFFAAQAHAKEVYDAAKPKIAMLKIAVAVPAGVEPIVTIDGERVPVANLNTNRPTNPGPHQIDATAPGYKKSSAKVELKEGGSDSVALSLEVDPNAPKPEPVAAQQPVLGPPPPAAPQRKPAYVAPLVAFGVGAVGLGVGAVFGAMALGKKGDLDDACGSKTACPASSQSDLDHGKTFGTVSTIGFVVGGVGVAAGAVMLATGWPKRSVSSAGLKIEPRVGLGSFALAGSF